MSRGIRLTCLLAAGAAGVAAMAVACNGGDTSSGQGQLAVELTSTTGPIVASFDALAPPSPSTVEQVWVCVTQVSAHSTSQGWVTISDPTVSDATPLCIDLLHLQPLPLPLGFADLPPGQVTQIRLLLSSDPAFAPYVVVTGVGKQPLTVPSGFQTGIKIIGPWDIVACQKLIVTLLFDAPNSIMYHATGQAPVQWILRPTIFPNKTSTSFICGETDGGVDGGSDGGGGVPDGGGGGPDGGTDGGPLGGTDGGPLPD